MDRNRSLRIAVTGLFVAHGLGMSSWIVHIPLVKERLELNDQFLGLALLCAGLGALGHHVDQRLADVQVWFSPDCDSLWDSFSDFADRTWAGDKFLVLSILFVAAGRVHRGHGHRHEQSGRSV